MDSNWVLATTISPYILYVYAPDNISDIGSPLIHSANDIHKRISISIEGYNNLSIKILAYSIPIQIDDVKLRSCMTSFNPAKSRTEIYCTSSIIWIILSNSFRNYRSVQFWHFRLRWTLQPQKSFTNWRWNNSNFREELHTKSRELVCMYVYFVP